MADNRVIIDFSVTGNGDVEIKKVEKSLEGLGKNGQDSLNKLSGAFNVFAGSLASDLVLGAMKRLGDAAGKLFDIFVVQGIDSAVKQQDALNQLGIALDLAGKNASGAVNSFDAFAAKIQQTTKFEDDAVISAGALLENLAHLSEKGLERATKASIDLAAALGKDLETTSVLVGKAIEGNTAALAKFGVRVSEGQTKAETFEKVMSELEKRFGGTAERQINTYSGAIAVASHNFSEIGEAVGKAIITNQSLINVIKIANDLFIKTTESVQEQNSTMSKFISGSLSLLVEGLQLVVNVSAAVVDGFLRIKATAIGLQGDISTVTNILTLGLTDAGKRAKESREKFTELKDEIKKLETSGTALDAIQAGLQALRNGVKDGIGKMADEAGRSTNGLNGTRGAIEEVSKSQQKLIDQGAQLAKQLEEKADPAVKYANEMIALEAWHEATLNSDAQFKAASLQVEEDYRNGISEMAVLQADILIEENNRVVQAHNTGAFETVQTNNKKLQEILKNEDLGAKQRLKIEHAYSENSKRLEEDRSQQVKGALSGLAAFQNSKVKELAIVGKAAGIANATIDTYAGASKALATIPPPFGFAVAAAIVAAGLLNVAKISGVDLATGITEVPPGYGGDTFPANLSSGERVVDGGTNEELKYMTATWPKMLSTMGMILQELRTMQYHFVVNIGSKTLVNEVRTGLELGGNLDV